VAMEVDQAGFARERFSARRNKLSGRRGSLERAHRYTHTPHGEHRLHDAVYGIHGAPVVVFIDKTDELLPPLM
jgi:hypothetical protein